MARHRVKESTIVGHVMSALSARGAWNIKTHGGSMQVSGIPDILACYRGRFLAFEVKNERGNPTPIQQYELKCITDAGGHASIVRSAEEVIRVMDDIDKELDDVSLAP